MIIEKKTQVMELWRQCFQDSEEFIQFYFKNKYMEANAMIYDENDKILSVLQMIPYMMTWDYSIIRASYISGACTLPEARNRGLMKQVIIKTIQRMFQRNISVGVLIPGEPWLYDYYRQFGFVPIFEYTPQIYYPRFRFRSYVPVSVFQPKSSKYITKLYNCLLTNTTNRPYAIQHHLDDFTVIIKDLYADGGKIFYTSNTDDKVTGIALVLPQEDRILVKEISYFSAPIKQSLLFKIRQRYPGKIIECRIPSKGKRAHTCGMARITDVNVILSLFAKNHLRRNLCIKVTDPQIEKNNGVYFLRKGISSKIEPPFKHKINYEVDIPTLTLTLTGGDPKTKLSQEFFFERTVTQRPFINLMLE